MSISIMKPLYQGRNIVALSVFCLALVACGDSKINAVKDTHFSQGDEFTIGENLSNVKECKSTDWSSELVNNMTIVTHTCTLAPIDEKLIQQAKEASLAQLDVEVQSDSTVLLSEDHVRSTIETARQQRAEIIAKLVDQLKAVDESLAAPNQVATAPTYVNHPSLGRVAIPAERVKAENERLQMMHARDFASMAESRTAGLKKLEEMKTFDQEQTELEQQRLAALAAQKDKLPAILAQTRAIVLKQIDAYYAKDRPVEVKTRFQYYENGPAKVIDATLVLAGESKGSTIPVYLMDPKRMGEFVTYLLKRGLPMSARSAYQEALPIRSDPQGGYRPKQEEAKAQ